MTTSYWTFALERSKLCKNLHGSGVYTSPYENGTVPVKKLTCFFQVPNLHTLPLKNSSSSAGPVWTQGGTVQVFVRAKICPDPCKRGLKLSPFSEKLLPFTCLCSLWCIYWRREILFPILPRFCCSVWKVVYLRCTITWKQMALCLR